MYKIVVCDPIHQSGIDILIEANDIDYVDATKIDKIELLDILKDADVAITRSPTEVDANFAVKANNLKAIVRAGVGVDNVDIDACSKEGTIVMNVPTANTIAATELTMAHMLSCVRKFPYAHDQLKNQRIWKREDWYGMELMGKKLGVIGCGNIGSGVATRAKAFGMDVVTYDPYIPSSKATDLEIKYTKDFADILACDIITIHTPKNSETVDMIGKEEIAKMKDGVILINCARGGLYNEDALYDGLKSGKIAMAGIDVFIKEPAIDHPLLDLPNVTVTAHLGANTKESQNKIATQAATNAIEAARGVNYKNALNLPIDESKIPEFVIPYLELTQKMAYLIAGLDKSAIQTVKVCAQGDISEYLDSLKTFVCVGALKQSLGDNINYVNAEFIAEQRSVKLESNSKANNSPFKNMITVTITTNNGSVCLKGTVFNDDVHRIVEFNGFDLDIEPHGKMIVFENTDVPGVIGEVGKILGDNSINIADFRLGRTKEKALTVIVVDSPVTSEVLAKLREVKSAISVAYTEI
jgi:D-3-phosphoglycerate dehydrogenase